MNYRLLVAEDDLVMAELLIELARSAGFTVTHHADGEQARQSIVLDPPDALLVDIRMPGLNGIDVIEAAMTSHPDLPAAIITGYATVPDVVRAFRAGVIDLVSKPFDNEQVTVVLNRFRQQLDRERRVEALAARLASLEEDTTQPQAHSRAMQKAMQLLDKVASLDTPVFLNGETGVGKGVLARMIHRASPRREGPWFSVNCAALADSVAESELFGHERGAFTGANARKRGVLELAHGGTLFLDEINSASAAIQTRLLEFVQEQTLRRVGGEKSFKVDVRIVVASNEDLQEAARIGRFREDLWYRLNVFPIVVPPLRHRREDILPLAEHFLLSFAREMRRPARQFSEDAEQLLMSNTWRGNVRELENSIHRAVILSENSVVERQHLPPEKNGIDPDTVPIPWSVNASLAEVESRWITHMLARCDGNKSETARCLGIDVSTLHRKLRELK